MRQLPSPLATRRPVSEVMGNDDDHVYYQNDDMDHESHDENSSSYNDINDNSNKSGDGEHEMLQETLDVLFHDQPFTHRHLLRHHADSRDSSPKNNPSDHSLRSLTRPREFWNDEDDEGPKQTDDDPNSQECGSSDRPLILPHAKISSRHQSPELTEETEALLSRRRHFHRRTGSGDSTRVRRGGGAADDEAPPRSPPPGAPENRRTRTGHPCRDAASSPYHADHTVPTSQIRRRAYTAENPPSTSSTARWSSPNHVTHRRPGHRLTAEPRHHSVVTTSGGRPPPSRVDATTKLVPFASASDRRTRVSLDMGMSTLRRWIRSRAPHPRSGNGTTTLANPTETTIPIQLSITRSSPSECPPSAARKITQEEDEAPSFLFVPSPRRNLRDVSFSEGIDADVGWGRSTRTCEDDDTGGDSDELWGWGNRKIPCPRIVHDLPRSDELTTPVGITTNQTGQIIYSDGDEQNLLRENQCDDEDEAVGCRHRALSEPESMSLRDYFFERAIDSSSRSTVLIDRDPPKGPLHLEEFNESQCTRRIVRDDLLLSSNMANVMESRPLVAPSQFPLSSNTLPSPPSTTSISIPTMTALSNSYNDVEESGIPSSTSNDVSGMPEYNLRPSASMPPPISDTASRANSAAMERISQSRSTPPSGDGVGAAGSSNGGGGDQDAERLARIRWIRINRRFQFVITMVALVFSLLLLTILICWVVFTSAYVISFDKTCDVPIKPYYWLTTLQLILDVFRSDIMRGFFNWDPGSSQRVPVRVIAYNLTYLVFALLVLRLGFNSVFLDESTCHKTAPELFNSAVAFVSLSLTAWATIICGYLFPFCVVAALLTYNGYNPSAHNNASEGSDPSGGASQPVFPAVYSTTGAPPGCVDQLRILRREDFPADYAGECCICMEEFFEQDLVVETACKHVFHKQCCREWLRQARTCPVCREDIPSTIDGMNSDADENNRFLSTVAPGTEGRIPMGPTGRPVSGLLRFLRRSSGNEGTTSTLSRRNNAAAASGTSPPSATESSVEMVPSVVVNP